MKKFLKRDQIKYIIIFIERINKYINFILINYLNLIFIILNLLFIIRNHKKLFLLKLKKNN